MGDEGEKVCPLCAEEMDLTDQQLKPCKCGYDVCVWCWHQIMEIAEKDETQGRCPACRTPYDKAKIVGMASRCERLVSEMNVDKKLKSQKGRGKPLEGRKQLDSVRVIRRNLVYVVGLPFHLADEDILRRREYFGQYGKVLKVSISRTSTGAIQHFPNNTCSVYITYSKEGEAIRCIQLIHGFVLDCRPLRACFGTTKYCHAWLRNVPCSNPDCLYLHEMGSQEDSFTKDEIISAYTRNQVQHIIGATYCGQQRSGTVLPSPTYDNSDTNAASQGKPTSKAISCAQNLTGAAVSSQDSSTARSAAPSIAASWGTHSSMTSNICVGAPPAQKPNVTECLTSLSKAAIPVSGKKFIPDEKTSLPQNRNVAESYEPTIIGSMADGRASLDGIAVTSIQPAHLPTTVPPLNTSDNVNSAFSSYGSGESVIDERDGNIENVCLGVLSMNLHMNQNSQNGYFEHSSNSAVGGTSKKDVNTTEENSSGIWSDFRSGLPSEESQVDPLQMENCSLSHRNERVETPEDSVNRVHDLCQASSFPRHSMVPSLQFSNFDRSISTRFSEQVVDSNRDSAVSASYFPNRHPEKILNSRDYDDAACSKFSLVSGTRSRLERYEGDAGIGAPDTAESSIISNMLASDFNPLNEPFVLPQNLGELFGEQNQLHNGVIGSRKLYSSSQSRFAFAREEDRQLSDFGRSGEDALSQRSPLHSNGGTLPTEKFVNQINFSVTNGMESKILNDSHFHLASSKISVPKSPVSAPPGFSVPSRLPPPGFPSLMTEHKFESVSGSCTPCSRLSQGNRCQVPMSDNKYMNGDIEFIDPAILAVGKGTPASSNSVSLGTDIRTSFPPHLGYERPWTQPVMHRSIPPYQSRRYPDVPETISRSGDSYGISSRMLEQKQSSNISPFSYFSVGQSQNAVPSNGPWDGWTDARSVSNFDVPEPLRLERMGSNDSYSSHEDSKKRNPGSDSLYNGMHRI